jgi:PKHD-type hydroxylase
MKGLYKVLKGLIDPLEAHEISNVIKKNEKKEGDPQVPKSHSYYSLPVCNILLGRLCEKISKAAGKKLKPSYTYCRVYLKGADLKPHKDRPSCEYSVTLNLSQNHPWPIFMGTNALTLNPGDGVLYKGCEIEHSREKFEGDEYVQVFLHYVDANGPHSNHVYDQNMEKNEPEYRFVFTNPNLFSNHLEYYRFINVIPGELIEDLRTFMDTQELHDALVGDVNFSQLKTSQRRTKISWIPKTRDFLHLYKLLFELIKKSNDEFYNFKLSEIIESIQYSVYTSEDQGHYDWHVDMGPTHFRKLSVVCHLSDPSEYEGGNLQINTGGNIVDVEKSLGTVIIFPSYMLHRVTPVTRGTRRTLVLWISGPPFT